MKFLAFLLCLFSATAFAQTDNTLVLGTQRGMTPTGGLQPIPLGGTAFVFNLPLAANAEVNTGWMRTAAYGSLLYVLRSDVPSKDRGITVEYSDDGQNVVLGGLGLTYDQGDVGMQIQRVLVPKAKFTRITYRNGANAQTSFRFEVKLSTTLVQPTEGSLNVPMTSSALALYTLTDMQLQDTAGRYGNVQRSGNAMRVVVDNQQPALDVTGLAKDETLTDGTQKTQVTSLPPVTITGTLPVTGSVELSGTPSVTISNGSIPVTGNFFPATQPVSGTVGISGSVPVTGTFWQATQPVSGSVSVANFPATQAVSVTGTVPVSGSFYQAVQPISGTVTANVAFPSNQNVTVTGTPTVNANVTFPASQAVTAAALPLPSGAATSALQTDGNSALVNIDADLGATSSSPATNATGAWNINQLARGIVRRPANTNSVSVSTLATATQVLAANPNRRSIRFYSVTGTILIAFGATSTTAPTMRLVTNTGDILDNGYTGPVWATGVGTLNISEFID